MLFPVSQIHSIKYRIQSCRYILTRSLLEYNHQIRVEKFKRGRVLIEAEGPNIVGQIVDCDAVAAPYSRKETQLGKQMNVTTLTWQYRCRQHQQQVSVL